MALSQRTATSGTLSSNQTASITLPAGTTDGDVLVVAIAEGNVSGPAAPSGWTVYGPFSAGTGQSLSIYTALYSASLTLSFTNIAASAAWVCNAYFEAGSAMALDGTPVAASSATSNTTMPTGAPTTGAAAGDYEILAYAWTSNTTISGVASGSTIDRTQANGASPSVALGHNNTNPLGASTTVTAFSQTLSGANTRKTGVGLLLRGSPVIVVNPSAIGTAEVLYAPQVFGPCAVQDTYTTQETYASYAELETFQATYEGMETSLCQAVTPNTIGTAQAVFAPVVTMPVLPQTVQPNTIATGEVLRQPHVLQSFTPATIGSGEQVFGPFVTVVQPLIARPDAIPTAEAVYAPAVVVSVYPDAIATAVRVYPVALVDLLPRWCPPSLLPAASPVAPVLSGVAHVPAPGLTRTAQASAPALSASAHHAAPALARAATSSAPPLREVELCRP